MKTLILAAGYAVRLYPLTLDMPKPLLEVGGRPMIDRILDKVSAAAGSGDIYIITNNKFFGKFNKWLKGTGAEGRISLVNDGTDTNEARLGAIKDLAMAINEKAIDDDLLVIAGDNLFECGLERFIAFARSHGDGASVAVYDIKSVDAARRFGVVELDRDKRIVDFKEKPQEPKSTLVSTGIYYFPRAKLPLIREYAASQEKKQDAPGYYLGWLSRTDRVYGFEFSEDWYDIGDIESYRNCDKRYKAKER